MLLSETRDTLKDKEFGAGLNSDAQQCKLIYGLTAKELNDHLKKTDSTFLDLYNEYKSDGCYSAAAALFEKFADLFPIDERISEEAKNILNLTVFSFQNDEDLNANINKINKFLSDKNEKKTIAFFTHRWITGGIEKVLSTLLSFMDSYNTILISLKPVSEEIRSVIEIPENTIHIMLSESKIDKISHRLASLLSMLHADIFIGNVHYDKYILKIYKILSYMKIKTIAYMHCSFFIYHRISYLNPLIPKIKESLSYADAVVWLTNFSLKSYQISNRNGINIPNPLNLTISDVSKTPSKNIIAVGRFKDPFKRLDLTLKIFKKVLNDHQDAQLTIVGPYDLNEKCLYSEQTFEDIMNELQFPKDKVVFAGERKDLKPYYEKAAVLLFTSEIEGFGMVLAEAGAFGTPAVICDIPGLEDIITDGENGFISDKYDIDGMAEKINYILSNTDVFMAMSEKAKKLVKRFEAQSVESKWKELIDELINAKTKEDMELFYRKNAEKNITSPQDMIRIIKEYETSAAENNKEIKVLTPAIARYPVLNFIFNQIANNAALRLTFLKPAETIYDLLKEEKEIKAIAESKYFDKKWYLNKYPEVKKTKTDPIKHYVKFGWKEGKDPSPDFSTNDYLEERPDVKYSGICPLYHWLKFGQYGK